MRSAPTPALQNVLVARPGTNSTAVVRRDDLLAAAVLAADEREPRRRSVLSVVHRRWARFSDSLRRRRGSSAASQAAAALAATDSPFRSIERNEVVAAFDRERTRQVPQEKSHDTRDPRDDTCDDTSVSSSRDNSNSRRLRQFGAKEDDDTLLMLPRVASVSFSSPENDVPSQRSTTPRVRQLPRVSALMPVRAPRPLTPVSPVSSEERESASSASAPASDSSYSDEYEAQGNDGLSEDEEDVGRKRALHRLPTGMTNVDVEREMEKAVVEIASDGDSDSGAASGSAVDKVEEKPLSGEGRAGEVRISTSTRSRSEAHRNSPRQAADDTQVIAAFSRRISSSTHTYSKRRMLSEDDARHFGSCDSKMRIPKSHDYSLFEDDYLSFQGFHGQPESRSHYQSMSSLLRSRRISSVTDSHSEKSDENAAVKTVASADSRRRQPKRNSILSNMFWNKRIQSDA